MTDQTDKKACVPANVQSDVWVEGGLHASGAKMQDDQREKAERAMSRRFFGRRKGQTLSVRKERLLAEKMPFYHISLPDDEEAHKAPIMGGGHQTSGRQIDPAELFGRPVRAVWFEVGFGKGEHLAWQARANPDVGFIGCEPFINGAVALLDRIVSEKLDNVRIYTDDARRVMDHLKPATIERFFLLHPDPWPKKRHASRRFVGQENITDIARLLVSGGEFRVASDHPLYRSWTALQMSARTDFFWLADCEADWRERPADWPPTRYETKALEGYPCYMRYRRL